MPSLTSYLPSLTRSRSGSGADDTESHSRLTLADVVRSYGWDWAFAIAVWCSFGWLNGLDGHKRDFSLSMDMSIMYTFAVHERVPPYLLFVISLVVPLVSVLLISIFVMRNPWDAHNSALAVLMAFSVSGLVTQIIKISVGRPRPDLIDRCQPYPGAHDRPVYGLSNISVCTQTDAYKLNDGFKSFPSGHSSLSFAGLGVLTFYLAGKFHLFSLRGHKFKAWLAFAPLFGATMVAVSRTMDNRHAWSDVLVGSLLGLAVAYASYRGYFPPLSHGHSDLPYAPREVDETMVELPGARMDHRYEAVNRGEGGLDMVVPRPSSDE